MGLKLPKFGDKNASLPFIFVISLCEFSHNTLSLREEV